MATYRARLSQEPDGSWIAAAVALPHCWSRGATADAALSRLRDEIRYRIEFCPCSGVEETFVQVEVVPGDAPSTPPAARVATSADSPPRSAPAVAALSGIAGCPPEPTRRASEPRPAAQASRPNAPAAGVPPRSSPPDTQGWRRWDD